MMLHIEVDGIVGGSLTAFELHADVAELLRTVIFEHRSKEGREAGKKFCLLLEKCSYDAPNPC